MNLGEMNWQERAEKAEAELARLAKQEPVTYVIDFNGYAINGKHTEIANALPTGMDLYAAPVPAVAAPAVPYGVDEEAANRIALAVYDCKHGINQEPLLYAINRILVTEAHPLSAEGQRALLQSALLCQRTSEPLLCRTFRLLTNSMRLIVQQGEDGLQKRQERTKRLYWQQMKCTGEGCCWKACCNPPRNPAANPLPIIRCEVRND